MRGGKPAGKLEWGKVRENERGETQKYAAFESYAPLPSYRVAKTHRIPSDHFPQKSH